MVEDGNGDSSERIECGIWGMREEEEMMMSRGRAGSRKQGKAAVKYKRRRWPKEGSIGENLGSFFCFGAYAGTWPWYYCRWKRTCSPHGEYLLDYAGLYCCLGRRQVSSPYLLMISKTGFFSWLTSCCL